MVNPEQGSVGKHALLFLAAALLAATCLLHFWKLGSAPRGFFFDESSIAYNAYAIACTGADEYGTRWPVFFRSFDTYTDPVAVYSLVLPLKVFGLKQWVTRVPSGLYCLATCVAFYLLLRQWRFGPRLALAGGFVLSVIPWIFPLSRNGSFAGHTAALLGLVAGLVLTDSALRRRSCGLAAFAGIVWAFAFYAHQSARPVLAVLAAGSAIVLWRPLMRRGRVVLVIVLSAVVVLLPMIVGVLRFPGALTARFQQVGISQNGASLGEITENAAIHYLDYFTPRFLFISGDGQLRHHTGHGGELYWCHAPLILVGLYVVIRRWRQEPRYRIVLVGLLVSPIAAAFTVDRMHSTRCVYGIIFWLLLAMIGARELWRHRRVGLNLLVVVSVLGALETVAYFADYFGAYQKRSEAAFETQLTDALRYCFANLATNETLYFSNSAISALAFNENIDLSTTGLSRLEVDQNFKPYVYAHILFFGGIDPQVYQQRGIPVEKVRLDDGIRPRPGLLLRCNAFVTFSTVLDVYRMTRNPEPVPPGAELMHTIPFEETVRYEIYRIR